MVITPKKTCKLSSCFAFIWPWRGKKTISDTPIWNGMGTSWTMHSYHGNLVGWSLDAEKMEDVVRWIKLITRKNQRWAVFHDLVDRYPLTIFDYGFTLPTNQLGHHPPLMIRIIITKQPSLFNYITFCWWKLKTKLKPLNLMAKSRCNQLVWIDHNNSPPRKGSALLQVPAFQWRRDLR